ELPEITPPASGGDGGAPAPELEELEPLEPLPPLDDGTGTSETLEELEPIASTEDAGELEDIEELPPLEELPDTADVAVQDAASSVVEPGEAETAGIDEGGAPVVEEAGSGPGPVEAGKPPVVEGAAVDKVAEPKPMAVSGAKPVATSQKAEAKTEKKIAHIFLDPPADHVNFIQTGFEVLTALVRSGESGEVIAENLGIFREKIKSIIGFSPCLFPMTSVIRKLKKVEKLEGIKAQDLLSNFIKWKGDIIEALSK
ncbi:MAG: hypothetical protein ACTSRA_08805, partial [Promethearchaeota archaeon]